MRITVFILVACLMLSGFEATAGLGLWQQALIIGRNSRIEVRMMDGVTLRGYLGEVSLDHLSLAATKAGGQSRDLMFSDIRSIRRPGRSTLIKVLLVAAGVGLVAWIATADRPKINF